MRAIRPELDRDTRDAKASLIDTLAAAALFSPRTETPRYIGRHRTAEEYQNYYE